MRLTFPILAAMAVLTTGGLSAAPGGEDYRTRLQAAEKARDEKGSQAALDAWKQARPDDPEYDIAAANHLLSRERGVVISTKKAAGGDFVLTDKTTGKEAGSLSSGQPSPETYRQAVELLKHGLSVAPQRMDIRFGLATLYQESNQPEGLVGCLSETAAYLKAHPGGLQGRGGKPFAEPADATAAREISGIANDYFQRGGREGDRVFRQLAKLDADAFPSRVYGHNLLGIYYTTIEKNPKLALASFDRALQIAPDDSYVWMNVGLLHAQAGEKRQAAGAFNKIIALNNDPSSVVQARAEIAKLK